MSYPHNETPLCQEHGCPDHGRMETEWMQVDPQYTVFQLCYMARESPEDLTYSTCEVYTDHKYTHHLCPHHDVILINERFER